MSLHHAGMLLSVIREVDETIISLLSANVTKISLTFQFKTLH